MAVTQGVLHTVGILPSTQYITLKYMYTVVALLSRIRGIITQLCTHVTSAENGLLNYKVSVCFPLFNLDNDIQLIAQAHLVGKRFATL